MKPLVLSGASLVTSEGVVCTDMRIEGGILTEVGPGFSLTGEERIDASSSLVFPGLIDCHVHFREPGLTHKEDMMSGAAAAVAGGATTVCEMPNTLPPTVTIEAFTDKVKRAARVKHYDIRFFFGATGHQHLEQFHRLWQEDSYASLRSRCCGLKLFLDHSTGNLKADLAVIADAFALCTELKVPMVCHCEDSVINAEASRAIPIAERGEVASLSLLRPAESEAASIGLAINLARTHGTQLHIAHLSTKQGLMLVRQAKEDSLSVTCDVTPHHLFLSTEDYESLGTLGKVNPPLRSPEHSQELWAGVLDGTVDCIGSDHAPHTREEKATKHPLDAPSGVPGVETMLPLLLTCASGKHPHPRCSATTPPPITHQDILRLCFTAPNEIFRLGKEGITPGKPLDIITVNLVEEWTIRGSHLLSKCHWTPYEGWRVRGRIRRMAKG